MKYFNIAKLSFLAIIVAFAGIMTACEDDLNPTNKESENNYQPTDGIYAYIANQNGKRNNSLIEFRETGNVSLNVKLNTNVTKDVALTAKYNAAALDKFNESIGAEYILLPENLVKFSNGNSLEIKTGSNSSSSLDLELVSDSSLDPNATYVVPLTVEDPSGFVKFSEKESTYFILVKDMTSIPSAEKWVVGSDNVSRRVQIISCMEMGDTNPLNNLSFTLKNSGKPLIDVLILFCGNINYNANEGRVYAHINEPIQHVLDNKDIYLKPLKDRGIKVVMGMMPNHDRASLTNLSEPSAKAFVQELKALMDAYDLDGVFWDEEYAKIINPAPPGFVEPSKEALSFLLYEFNRVMPDKMSMAYVYSSTAYLLPVNGKESGQYITHGLHDYGGGSPLDVFYPGLPKSGWGMYSQEYAKKINIMWSGDSRLRNIKDNGYCHMIFAMDPYRNSYRGSQLPSMSALASDVFGDELVVGEFHKKNY